VIERLIKVDRKLRRPIEQIREIAGLPIFKKRLFNVERLRDHYQILPEKLRAQNVNPRIPLLYDFKLDSRFR
jgi:hypothetical protein